MNLEEVAGQRASQIELDASRSAQSRLSQGIQTQLASILEDCITHHPIPPRIDVVSAIERLQTIGPALPHPKADEMVITLIHHLNQCDPTTIQTRADLVRLIQCAIPSPINVAPTRPKSTTASNSFHRHRNQAHPNPESTSVSHAIKRLIKFIFG